MNKEQIIKTLNNENLNKDAMGELLWLLDKDFYKEKPVSIEEFYSSKEFVAEKWPSIFPLWKQTLNELFPTPFNAPYNEVLISAAAGSGKCLAKDTPILMYDGTIKMVQDIQVGDQLMGPDSKPRNVLSTCTGTEQMYDIVPTRGGETWGCNESHILSLKCGWDKTDRGAKYHKDDVYNMSIKDYLKRGKSSRQILRLYRASVDFPNQQELEIDPYIYGLWLGDGSTRNPSLTSIDEELIDTWCNYANDNGYQIRIEEQENNKSKTYHCNHGNIGGKENKFRTFINESTETGHKRILHRYKTASREDRWKLLAGIIDTDGYKKPGINTWEITSKYEDLAQDYAFVARSLGCRVSVKKKEKCQYNGKFYDAWRVIIGGDLRECPIKLERKKAEGEFKDGDPLKTSFKVVDKGIGDYYGFTIDGDHLFMLGDFTVTHNTVTATISILYDMYKLACLKDPCAYYQLAPGTMIIMAIFSATASTAKVNWNEITQGILACPWIMRRIKDRRGVERKIGPIVPVEVMPGVFVQTGSKFQHSMGKAIFDGLMDEAAFGGANMKDAQKSYNELSSRMKTRFGNFSDRKAVQQEQLMDEAAFGGANMKDSQKSYNELSSRIKTRFSKWGNKGNTPGQLFLISSPKEAGDFMQFRIEKAQEADSKLTKIVQNVAIWDADPRKDSEDKFTVFIGNENKEPCIYEQDADIPLEEMDDLLYVPTKFLDDFKKDLLISIMNYGGITTTSDMALFKSPTLLNDVCVLNNPFNMDVITLPFAKTDKQLMDFCNINYFRDIRHPECNRFIHIDAAYSTNTLDVYGLAASYCVLAEQTTFKNENFSGTIEETDVFTKRDRMFFTDFVIGITAPKGEEVNLGKVQDFIEYLIKNCGYPVACITADQFQSKQTLQNLETKGYQTDYVSVDRTRDPYLFLRHLVHNKQILIPKNQYSLGELKKLRDDGKKIDHPVGWHNDTADAIAGSIWKCANSTDIINKGKVISEIMAPGSVTMGNVYSPEQLKSMELMEFERLKQQFKTGIFKGM